jgi:hypothetical protein
MRRHRADGRHVFPVDMAKRIRELEAENDDLRARCP